MAKRVGKTKNQEGVLRDYYDKSSSLDEGTAITPAALSFPKPRRLVALRLEEETVDAIRRMASEKGLNYSTLMRMWITERLQQERGQAGGRGGR